jgi:hypothetical protein
VASAFALTTDDQMTEQFKTHKERIGARLAATNKFTVPLVHGQGVVAGLTFFAAARFYHC